MGDRFAFTAELWRTRGEAAWYFVTLPPGDADLIADMVEPGVRGFGSVRVEVSVGTTTWRTSIFPDSKSGSFVLPVKKAVRVAERLDDGEPVDVRLSLIER